MVETPKVLFRVTRPSKFTIKDGYVMPHHADSIYGKSLPTIARRDLFTIACFFAHPEFVMKSEPLGYFFLLRLKTEALKNVSPRDSGIYDEFLAEIPISALICITKYSWKDNWLDAYDDNNLPSALICHGRLSPAELETYTV